MKISFEEYMGSHDCQLEQPDCDYCRGKRSERKWNGYTICGYCGAELRSVALFKRDLVTGEKVEITVGKAVENCLERNSSD